MQRPAQAKDFQLTMAYDGDAFNRRWQAGLAMARQKFGISRQYESAPFLARSGLEAHATVRVEEDTGSVPCSPPGSRASEHERAQIQRRAVAEQPPVRTFWQILRTQEREGNR
jgi:hypothetical protein